MKTISPNTRFRFFELCEQARDAGLGDAQCAELNQLAGKHPELLGQLAESLFYDAQLRQDGRLVADFQAEIAPMVPKARYPVFFYLLAAAACAMFGFWGFQSYRKPAVNLNPAIATLVKAKGCKWAASSLPTVENSRVSAGTYELVEGLATLRFDSGAEVVLEAPATLELIDAMSCRLVRGTLVSDVPPSAIGFTVETLKARVVDFGTRFGVSAGADGEYMVQVLSGKVEVEDHTESSLHKLSAGENMDRGMLSQKRNPQAAPAEPNRWRPDRIVNDGDGWQLLSTGFGAGKDAYVDTGNSTKNYGADAYFRVKRTTIQKHLNRKGYLGFDLRGIAKNGFTDAELVLSIEPSELGFATLVPDSKFMVYGLTAETGDDWSETSITALDAPAHDAAAVDLHLPVVERTILLGEFTIDQGVTRGSCRVGGQALVDFLNTDTNGIVTLIICRETDETAKGGLVHAFATKENGNNSPPVLRFKVGR